MPFKQYDTVEADFQQSGKWYGAMVVAVISSVAGPTTYHLVYFDDDTEFNVNESSMRLQERRSRVRSAQALPAANTKRQKTAEAAAGARKKYSS